MQCPRCQSTDNRVLDTRAGRHSLSIKRRRQCNDCLCRFTTVETIVREGIEVIKRSGRREEFDRVKLYEGIRKATEKRPIQAEQIDRMIAEMTEHLERQFDREIPTQAIGEAVMERLKRIDQIAYVRYACVYKDFRDIKELTEDLQTLYTPLPDHSTPYADESHTPEPAPQP